MIFFLPPVKVERYFSIRAEDDPLGFKKYPLFFMVVRTGPMADPALGIDDTMPRNISVSGQRVEYYYEISFIGPDAATPTNFPAGGPAETLHFIVRKQIDTTYTNMAVTGSFNEDMIAVEDFLTFLLSYDSNAAP